MRAGAAILFSLALGACARPGDDAADLQPAGAPMAAGTAALAAGATALQTDAPPDALDIYLVGFHPLKEDPEHQVEAHHFCRQINEDLVQCALFDGGTPEANLTGIEYIVSERLFLSLPVGERPYWHPHNGEILSGQLIAPGLPQPAEHALMRQKMNSYGKTWHTWDTAHGAVLPLGSPALAWSFSRFGEANSAMVQERDRRMGISTEANRRDRLDLEPLARPQYGVDTLEGRFDRPTAPIPDVVEASPAP